MLGSKTSVLSLLAMMVASTMAGNMDISEELAQGWRMGLRPRQASQNLQTFSNALGGASAAAITNSGDPDRPFAVEGDTFPDFKTAANRACDNQKNDCAKIANEQGGEFKVSDCDDQSTQCKAQIDSATVTEFPGTADPVQAAAPVLVSSNANFDFFCDV